MTSPPLNGSVALGRPWYHAFFDVPYESRGRSVDGADCWGFVCLVFQTLHGITLPDFADVDPRRGADANHAFTTGSKAGMWLPVGAGAEAPFDVIVVHRAYRGRDGATHVGPRHCGLVSRPGFILHCDLGAGVAEVPYAPAHATLQSRRFDFYRWRAPA